ncbi:LSU ribosomal protein L21p [hydrothermal vent metagenome]|uniref:LSU ribosomal protein L21p n=1 Tax=hydrothermal vent metagenome TaxID=652676 RepID=A0A3B1DGU2_9ZZZZ
MFAIIEEDGRQYKVSTGDRLQIDYRAAINTGDRIAFSNVLLANTDEKSLIGKPTIEGATVSATVLIPEEKGEKLEVQKLRRRKNSRRHTGHRQKYTIVSISEINVPGFDVVSQEKVETEAPVTDETPAVDEAPTASETTEES